MSEQNQASSSNPDINGTTTAVPASAIPQVCPTCHACPTCGRVIPTANWPYPYGYYQTPQYYPLYHFIS